jgi:L-ascorbate metabolism protein UlaG (beta-lactamase superfamily)
MKRFIIIGLGLLLVTGFFLTASENKIETEIINTTWGPLKISFIGHGTVMFQIKKLVIHVDPFSRVADYSTLPKADLVLLTHHHGDHLDSSAIDKIKTKDTIVVLTRLCREKYNSDTVMANGDIKTIRDIKIEAVPAYNIVHKRSNGAPYHPRGEGNGYVLTFGDKRVYIGGDTENTPEMKALEHIDAAFLPMNLPYTMTPEMVVDAVKAFKPKILYPYHFGFGKTDLAKLESLMKDVKGVDLRIHNRK